MEADITQRALRTAVPRGCVRDISYQDSDIERPPKKLKPAIRTAS